MVNLRFSLFPKNSAIRSLGLVIFHDPCMDSIHKPEPSRLDPMIQRCPPSTHERFLRQDPKHRTFDTTLGWSLEGAPWRCCRVLSQCYGWYGWWCWWWWWIIISSCRDSIMLLLLAAVAQWSVGSLPFRYNENNAAMDLVARLRFEDLRKCCDCGHSQAFLRNIWRILQYTYIIYIYTHVYIKIDTVRYCTWIYPSFKHV